LVLDLLNLNYFGCSAKKVGGGVGLSMMVLLLKIVAMKEILLLFKIEYDDIFVEDCIIDRSSGVSLQIFFNFFYFFFFK
jgi:hypothetical protein